MSQQMHQMNNSQNSKMKMSTFYDEYQHGFHFMKEVLEEKPKEELYEQIQDGYDEQVYKALSSGVYEVKYNEQDELLEENDTKQHGVYHSVQINVNKYDNESMEESLFESCCEREQAEPLDQQQKQQSKPASQNIAQHIKQQSSKKQVQSSQLQHDQENTSQQADTIQIVNQYEQIVIQKEEQKQQKIIQQQGQIQQEVRYPVFASEEYKVAEKYRDQSVALVDDQQEMKYQEIQNQDQNMYRCQQTILENNSQGINKSSLQKTQLSMNNLTSMYESQEEKYDQPLNPSLYQSQTIINHKQIITSEYEQHEDSLSEEESQKKDVIIKQQQVYAKQSLKIEHEYRDKTLKSKFKSQELVQINYTQQKPVIKMTQMKEDKKVIPTVNKIIKESRQIKEKEYVIKGSIVDTDWRRLKWKGIRRLKRQEDSDKTNKRAIIAGYNKQFFLLLETQVYDIEIKSKDLNYTIKRTFYDFNRLEELIKVYYRGHILQPFPQANFQMFKTLKLSIGKQEEKIILNERRLFQLQKYLNYLLNHQNIKSSILLQIFLNPNEQFFKKEFNNLQKITNQRQKESQGNLLGQKYNDIKKVFKFGWSLFNQYMPTLINSPQNLERFHKLRLQSGKNQQMYASVKIKIQEFMRQASLLWQRICRLKKIYSNNADLPNIESSIDSVLILSSKMSSSKSYYEQFSEWIEDNIATEVKSKIHLLSQITELIKHREELSVRLRNLRVQDLDMGQRIVEKQSIFDQRFLSDWQKRRQQFQQDIKQLRCQMICVWKYYSKLMIKIWKDTS